MDASTLTANDGLSERLQPGKQPEQPALVKRRDGTYAYAGRGFDATIERDGTVRMRDRFVRAKIGLFPRRGLNEEWFVYFFETKYDLLGWLEKKFGNDPYRSERHWFLVGTYDLRDQLATTAASAKMRESLNAIWSKANLSFAERKRHTFELWDTSAEDEVGKIGRAQVIDFVRESCPAHSARGFRPEELKALNETRRSRELFAPYAAAGSGP